VIELLSGRVARLATDSLTLMVAGVGFRVAITPRFSLKLRLDQDLEIVTKLVVREDDLALFGFESQGEQESFDLLCSVSGIGPKLAMTVLSGMDAQQIANAVNAQDDSAFRAISGIGPKTAKLIVISLANKVGLSSSSPRSKVLEALLQLGTDEALARDILSQLTDDLDNSAALKQALALLGKSKLVER
jgi:Holliday junction DNA helicase RuvA